MGCFYKQGYYVKDLLTPLLSFQLCCTISDLTCHWLMF